MKKYILFPSICFILLVTFGFGFLFGKVNQPSINKIEGLTNKEIGKSSDIDFSLFWDAWKTIQDKYVERDDLNKQEMVYGAIEGLLKSLDDPYSVFMKPEEKKKFIEDMSGSFSGIGAEIGIRKDILTIISPLEDSPAQKAGLRAGDRILKINDTITLDLSIDEAVNLIRGERGTEVLLLISRDGWDNAKEFKIIRDTIKVPIIKYEIKNDNIAYVRLTQFTDNSASEFSKIARKIIDSKAKGIIFDLRNNPGGYLEAAVDIASWFTERDQIIVVEDFGNGDKNEYTSAGYRQLKNIPLMVLINEGSASASEILAGALHDLNQTILVGKKSFGKGSVQQLERLKDGSGIKITVAKWLTPNGTSISQEGIMPDYEIEITEDDFNNMRDPQLDKALELLK